MATATATTVAMALGGSTVAGTGVSGHATGRPRHGRRLARADVGAPTTARHTDALPQLLPRAQTWANATRGRQRQ